VEINVKEHETEQYRERKLAIVYQKTHESFTTNANTLELGTGCISTPVTEHGSAAKPLAIST
jgi:hypothetical protein